MTNIIKHFLTITKHRNQVMLHCFRAGIPIRGLLHDLSKYSPSEFVIGVKFYQGYRSPNEAERECYGYSRAWMHHKGRNKHHFEYWTDLNRKTNSYEPVEMPLKYVTEMFCDRVAASKIYTKEKYTDFSALEYFHKSRAGAMMHPKTFRVLESWLIMLGEKGEKETFRYIRGLNSRRHKRGA